jgi:2-C-methyl-D-erythritol 4-phosphate cytidylyltransferase/2-C-methyl-D-erythritol 2,4-cyclodiphosphate synthase
VTGPDDPSSSTPAQVGAIIVAAGAGTRLPGGVPKPFRTLGSQVMLDRVVGVFERCAPIDRIAVVVAGEHVAAVAAHLSDRVAAVVAGGATRRDSVAAGLRALPEAGWIVVHDGARPFVSPALVSRVLDAAREAGAATAGLPVTDTLKRVDGGRILRTVDRSVLWSVQTPQAFRAALLRKAHARTAGTTPVTDDAELVERLGSPVVVVPGDPANTKITTPGDLELAQQRLSAEQAESVRIGIGYDIHRLVPDRPLVLGGVTIPHARGLEGHSDADVLTHAIMDALLGAAGDRDIGHHFPSDAPAFAGADSVRLLATVVERLAATGWRVANIDTVVVAEAPRLAPYVEAIRARLAGALGVGTGSIGVKATTGEGLGPLGRGEGIAAQAVALVRRAG